VDGFTYTFPLQVLDLYLYLYLYLKHERKVDVIKFDFVDEFGWISYGHELASFSLKSPDDFTRSVPKRVRRKLEILKTTHFDYSPKILDGALLYKEETLPVQRDPGLTLCVGEDRPLILCDFWSEPSAANLKGWTKHYSARFFSNFLFVYSVPLLIAALAGRAAAAAWNLTGTFVDYILAFPLATISVLALIFELFAFMRMKETGRDEILPNCRRYIPKKKLVI
jgi:hypothetical protein